MGYTRTAILMAAMSALFMGLGYLIGGSSGALMALVVAGLMNALTWWNSDRMVLRMHNARPVTGSDSGLVTLVAELARNADMPIPAVYVIETDQPNAFATGRSPQHAAVAVTTGLLQRLSRQEVAGVIAHELAHIRNHDTAIMTVTATFAGAIGMLARLAILPGSNRDRKGGGLASVLMLVLAPLAAAIVQMAISRSREYEADRIGAEICRNPLWLASALEGIQRAAGRIDYPAAERNPATAHMFIINPLHATKVDNLFATHPATENRVAKLKAMAAVMHGAPPVETIPLRRSSMPEAGRRDSGGPWR